MKKEIKLIIDGEPMGKQRPKFTSAGKFVRTYTPKETVNYESKVVYEYKKFLEQQELPKETVFFGRGDEIWATIIAYYPITKDHYRYHKKTGTTDLNKEGQEMLNGIINPTKKPDCDNIAKVVLDALNGIAFPDDSQITCLLVVKRYAEKPRVELSLERGNRDGIE